MDFVGHRFEQNRKESFWWKKINLFSTNSIIRIIAVLTIDIIIFSLTKHIIVCTELQNWHVEKLSLQKNSGWNMFVHISQDSDVLEKDDVNSFITDISKNFSHFFPLRLSLGQCSQTFQFFWYHSEVWSPNTKSFLYGMVFYSIHLSSVN